jgi:flagellin
MINNILKKGVSMLSINNSMDLNNLVFLQKSKQQYNEILAKIGSGQELTSAASNASGMMIADQLRNYAETLSQNVANSNDSIGMAKIADGAMNVQSQILDDMKVKAVAANSAIHNSSTLSSIKGELQDLSASYNNIANTTSYNGKSLLRGFSGDFEVGGASLANLNIGDTALSKVNATNYSTGDITGLASDGSDKVQLQFQRGADMLTLNEVEMGTGVGQGVGELAKEINKYSDQTGLKASYDNTVTSGVINQQTDLTNVSINGVNLGDISLEANDSTGTLVDAINSQTTDTGVEAMMGEDGTLSLKSIDGRGMQIDGLDSIGIANDTYSGNLSLVSDGKPVDIKDLNSNVSFSSESVNLEDAINNMSSSSDAGVVGSLLDNAISDLSSNRGSVGSFQNQMVAQSEVLSSTYVNTKYSESQIRDADIAEQLAELMKQQGLTSAELINQQYINKYRSGIMALLN